MEENWLEENWLASCRPTTSLGGQKGDTCFECGGKEVWLVARWAALSFQGWREKVG